MAAPQIPGTPAAAPAPAESITAGAHGIDAILGDLSDLPAADGAEGGDGADAIEQVAEADAQPADKAAKLDDEVIFSDESLQTPEGIAKARERVKNLRRLSHEKYLELKNYEKRVVKRSDKLRHQIEQHVASKRNDMLLVNNVRSNVDGLRSNDPNAILTALGNLTGRDGLAAYELITNHIVNRGPSKIDPQVQAVIDQLKSQVEELKGGLGQRELADRHQRVSSSLSQRQQELGQTITSSAAQLPHLSRLHAEDPQHVIAYITDELTQLHKSGAKLDIHSYFGNLEQQLARHFGGSQAPNGDGGGPAPKQPSQAQRSPGQSVGPRTAAASNPRVPSEDESLRALASDTAFLSSLGL